MSKFNSFNSVTAIGYVTNFKVTKMQSGKNKADIGIKDELTNNMCFCVLFESDNLKYNDKPVTLNGLKNIFLDSDDKPRHILVRGYGKVAENKYINKQGIEVTDSRPILFGIAPETNTENQGIVFLFRGIVDTYKEINDGDGFKIRLGIAKTDKDKNLTGLEWNNVVVVDSDLKEKLEDKYMDKYSQIEVAGDILNIIGRDKYGSTGENIKEMRVMRVNSVVSSDDIENFEDIYPVLKKGGTVTINASDDEDNKSNKKPNKSKPSNDDDDLDF